MTDTTQAQKVAAGDGLSALVAKHRAEIDRVKLMDSKGQMEEFRTLGVDPADIMAHYKTLNDQETLHRQADDHATAHKKTLGWASFALGTIGAYFASRKLTESKLVRFFAVPITGVASGLTGTFVGSRLYAGDIREDSRKMVVDAKNALERELAVALENRDQTATVKTPDSSLGDGLGQNSVDTFVRKVTDKTASPLATFENLADAPPTRQTEIMTGVISKLKEQYGDEVITSGTERVMREKYNRGEAIILYGKNKAGDITAASFSLVNPAQQTEPGLGIYTYEAAPRTEKSALASASIDAIRAKIGGDAPVFLEGNTAERSLDEARGFRSIRYDTDAYKWGDDKDYSYKWMVSGNEPPALESMKTAIHMQRAFVVASEQKDPDKDFFTRPLPQQVNDAQARKEYGVDESIAHAESMAVGGKMELEPLIRQVKLNQQNELSR